MLDLVAKVKTVLHVALSTQISTRPTRQQQCNKIGNYFRQRTKTKKDIRQCLKTGSIVRQLASLSYRVWQRIKIQNAVF